MPRLMHSCGAMRPNHAPALVQFLNLSSNCLRISSVNLPFCQRWFPSGKRSLMVLLARSGLRSTVLCCTKASFLSLIHPCFGRNCWRMLMEQDMKACRRLLFGFVLHSTIPGLPSMFVSIFGVVWFVKGTRQNICIQVVCCSRLKCHLWCGVISLWISWRDSLVWVANLLY